MYPIKKGFISATNKIESLLNDGHISEAFLASVFVCEKTFRRVIRALIVSTGFKSKIADKVLYRIRGLEQIKQHWEFYAPEHRQLIKVIKKDDWNVIKNASKIRNDLVHGVRVYKRSFLREETEKTLSAITNIEKTFRDIYGYGGWTTPKARRISKLHTDPRIKFL